MKKSGGFTRSAAPRSTVRIAIASPFVMREPEILAEHIQASPCFPAVKLCFML